ncbi:MAG: hypothetical protein WCT46_03340 [Candidatus Gracilibacteria bacterium]|jgi:hypothetical protein
MKNALKVALVALVVVVVGAGVMVRSCLSAINEAEADTRAFFQTIVDQGSQVAYDQTSDYFKEVTTFEDFDGFVQEVGMSDFTDFQSSGYAVSTADGLSTKTVNGAIMFNDGASIDIYFDWVKVGEEWKVLGFGAAAE